jgi:arsenate reductase
MSDKIYNVLFLCTGNSARSILAESILRKEGKGRFNTFSAGSFPKGEVHPLALKTLKALDYPYEGFRSKSWDEFAVWPGHPMTAHWGVEDPAAVEGSEFERERAFSLAARYLKNRIAAFTSLPIASIDKIALQTRLRQIGTLEGTTSPNDKAG